MSGIDHEGLASDFDRRSLIKKGLVFGGVAATVPVISTFNAPAFAGSIPGLHQVDFFVPILGGILGTEPNRVGVQTDICATNDIPQWADGTPDNPGSIDVTVDADRVNGDFVFTLTGSYASCEIIGIAAVLVKVLDLICIDAGSGSFSGVGTNQVTYTPDLLGQLSLLGIRIHLLVSC